MKLVGERNYRSIAKSEGAITSDPPSPPGPRLNFREQGKIVAACLALVGSVYFCSRIPGWIADGAEFEYADMMRYWTLPEFHERHGRWPKTLEELERDFEQHDCPDSDHCNCQCPDAGYCKADAQSLIDTYRRYQPKMTVLSEDRDVIRLRLDFTRGYPGTYTTLGERDDEAEDSGAGSKDKSAAVKPGK